MMIDAEDDDLPANEEEAAKDAVKAELWRRGMLRWKLDPSQRAMLEARDAALSVMPGGDVNQIVRPWYFFLCHRGFGKTFMMIVDCFEEALRYENARVLYLAPEGGTDAAAMFRDVAETFVLQDCPEDVRPKYNPQDNEYRFPTSLSVLRFRGVNGEKIEKLRGFGARKIGLDEAGSMDDLSYAINSVLMPVVTRMSGRLTLATTIPRTPQHESMAVYDQCAADGLAKSVVLRDNQRLSWDRKALDLIACGESRADVPAILDGTKNPITVQARREYFNERISDASQMVIPEWTDAARKDLFGPYRPPEAVPGVLAKPIRGYSDDGTPAFRDCYVGMDPGFQDRTGLVFGYLDYARQKFVVEHAEVLSRPGTQDVADAVHAVEQRLWPEERAYLRVSDIDLRLISDLADEHGLEFAKAEKKGRMVDRITQIRQAIRDRRLEIRPGASLLDDQLRSAVWNSVAKDFERTAEGHSDLVAALMYMLAAVDWKRDPYPRNWWDGDLSPLRSFLRDQRRAKEAAKFVGTTPFARRISERYGR